VPIWAGDAMALACALAWAITVILYRRVGKVSPESLNLFKNALATVLLVATMIAFDIPIPTDRTPGEWAALAASGVLGVAVADTLFFAGLQRIDASVAALTDCLYAPSVMALSILILGEVTRVGLFLGGPLVVVGVFVVSTEKVAFGVAKVDKIGVALAAGGVLMTAVAVIVAKPVLDGANLVEATLIRLLAGSLALLVYQLVMGRLHTTVALVRSPGFLRKATPAAVMGAYVSMLLWLGGIKYGNASRVAILNQLGAVFVLVLSRFLGDTVSARRWFGVALAVLGAIVVLLL
jgi:drug/metabolite transporter (DMT)-like permease